MSFAPKPRIATADPSHSVMEDVSDSESDPDLDAELDPDQQQFYIRQQQQAMYYQQHQQQYGSATDLNGSSAGNQHHQTGGAGAGAGAGVVAHGDDEEYSDDGSSMASIPDENIDFTLTYALHTFVATVEGQASVVKGDSLLLLDDANSYWWLVRVLKTEDVGYIPAENIETPYERLARLNKHRNVDLAAATVLEKQAVPSQGKDKFRGLITGKTKAPRKGKSDEGDDSGPRRVIFAPPTYVDHPGVTWSSDEESDEEDEGDEAEEVEGDESMEERQEGAEARYEGEDVDESLQMDMEPDDGVEWADGTGQEEQKRVMEQKQQGPQSQVQPKSNNPFARPRDPYLPPETASEEQFGQSNSTTSLVSSTGNGSPALDPAQAGNDTRRITVTPSVAQAQNGPLLPSQVQNMHSNRNVSGQSTTSVASSAFSTGSNRSDGPSSPTEDGSKKAKKMKKASKEDLSDGGEKRRSKGMLSGLFSRNKDKNKKGISSSDPRNSEDSIVSGAVEGSPGSLGRNSEDSSGVHRAPTPAERQHYIQQQQQQQQPVVSGHGLRLQQKDQALQQAYMNKYLTKSSSSGDLNSPTAKDAAQAVAQSAAAMRLQAMGGGSNGKRPSSIILSPNPAGPPLLNVIRVFAGDHVKSDASFKTVLLNETTSATDLIRQLMQRFRLHSSADSGYYLTIKDVSGEEMELEPNEKPLSAFQEAVERWASEDEQPQDFVRAMTPTVKRSSISSISSIASLSNHPAIAKLGMNDFSDDSAVKIYLHRRRPGSQQLGQGNGRGNGMPEPASEFSSYSTQLSVVQESSPELHNSGWSSGAATNATPPGTKTTGSETTDTPPTPQPRYNPSLTISTSGQSSPERFSSPSARFTIQLLIHPQDLPDNSTFDPTSEAIVSKQIARDRHNANGASYPMDSRRRLYMLPRNATVVEAIEQGLERFGIQEGMVDGGDDVEDKAGDRRSLPKVRYSLAAVVNDEERQLAISSKILDAYPSPPQFRPVDRMTTEQRRRSRDFSQQNAGSPSDILPSDPVFILRRVQPRLQPSGILQRQQAQTSSLAAAQQNLEGRGPLSPQEIIAAQRAASRANQKALISAHTNTDQGVDVVLPDRGTFRSSRLIERDGGEVVRYSYIDDHGETYDISELLEEEWGKDESKASPALVSAPALLRTTTDSSQYVTAPSTPEPGTERQLGGSSNVDNAGKPSKDILKGAVQRAAGQPEGKLEEKLQRVINKVKSVNGPVKPVQAATTDERAPTPTGRTTPSGRSTPQGRPLTVLPEGRTADVTPRASAPETRSGSRQANYQQTAASVNRIVSRHRQQPSIASIMSDFSASPAPESLRDPPSASASEHEHDEDHEDARDGRDRRGSGTGTSTPMTATSSTHPTPPFSGTAIFTRSISTASPTPRAPVSYTDDFGIKNLMAIIDIRSRDRKPKKPKETTTDAVEKKYYGEKVDWEGVHPDIKGCFVGLVGRLDKFDRDVDDLLASCLQRK